VLNNYRINGVHRVRMIAPRMGFRRFLRDKCRIYRILVRFGRLGLIQATRMVGATAAIAEDGTFGSFRMATGRIGTTDND